MMIDFSSANLDKIINHHIGNKQNDENINLTDKVVAISDETSMYLQQYFLEPLKQEEVFSFTHAVSVKQNDIYLAAKSLFTDRSSLVEQSKHIAQLLYESSNHPKIHAGELSVVLFSKVIVEDELMDAIGIFKSESNVPFIKMERHTEGFDVSHDFGFEMKGVDKGCLILNVEKSDGYRCLLIDTKSADTYYWKDDFLKVKPIGNEFYLTNEFLSMTKEFVTKKLPEEYEMDKTDKIDLLNKSVGYFKNKDHFDKEEFMSEVFVDEEIMDSFQSFDKTYSEEYDIQTSDNFAISAQAVRRQSRVYKSVLKLDKNFHVYIHGDKSLIERGVEEDGRKYYKIYYNEEK